MGAWQSSSSVARASYPAIEFEDGSLYREESKDMEATIRAGKLFEKSAGSTAATSVTPGPIGESSLQ